MFRSIQAASASEAPGSHAPPTATETVTRPEPGLARGKWEAPVWAFWVALAVVVVGAGLYVARRLGLLRRKRRAPDVAPVSKRGARP